MKRLISMEFPIILIIIAELVLVSYCIGCTNTTNAPMNKNIPIENKVSKDRLSFTADLCDGSAEVYIIRDKDTGVEYLWVVSNTKSTALCRMVSAKPEQELLQ